MGLYTRQMREIRKGDEVRGDDGRWYLITKVDHDRKGGTVVLTGWDGTTGRTAQLWGNEKDCRILR